ncbi:MAG: cupin domain-containing protein [Phycisphaerales bacterium]
MPTEARRIAWSDLPQDRPMDRIARRRIIAEHMMVSEVRLEPGFDLASHAHANEQLVVMLQGRCLFGLGEPGTPAYRETELRTGEVLVLPPNVPHSCRALEPSHILDLFSPPSATTGVDRPTH